jgi:hypothetical protein
LLVPDDDEGVDVEIVGQPGEPDAQGLVPVALTATCQGEAVLGKAVARVRPDG